MALAVVAVWTQIGAASPGDAAATTPRWDGWTFSLADVPVTEPPTTTTTTITTTTTVLAVEPAPPPPPTTAAPPPAPPPPPERHVDAAMEARAVQLVNDERARAGLAPLQLSAGARSVGRGWSDQMATAGLGHNPDLGGDLDRAGVGWRTIGENVGYGGSVDQIQSMFMASAGHRANILSADYTAVGIGVVVSGDVVWLTMDFVG